MAQVQVPTLSRATSQNTAYYSLVSNASTVHPAEMSAPAKTNRTHFDSDPSPDYRPETNGSTSAAPIDAKVVGAYEKRPMETMSGGNVEKEVSPMTTSTEASGDDVVVPASPSSTSREEQLGQHAVGTFADGAAVAVSLSLSRPRNRPDRRRTIHRWENISYRTQQAIPARR